MAKILQKTNNKLQLTSIENLKKQLQDKGRFGRNPFKIETLRPKTECVLIRDLAQLKQELDSNCPVEALALDIETSGFDPYLDQLISIQIVARPPRSLYIPLNHVGYAGNIDAQEFGKFFGEYTKDPKIIKIGHNLKFDMKWLMLKLNLEFNNIWDTMIAAFLLDENRRVGLKGLAKSELNVEMTEFSSLGVREHGKKLKIGQVEHFGHIDVGRAMQYACADADLTYQLYQKYKPQIEKDFKKYFYEIEMPMVKILAEMELSGVEVDAEYLKAKAVEVAASLQKLEASAVAKATAVGFANPTVKKKTGDYTEPFNVRSPNQIRAVMDLMGIESIKLTENEEASTDKFVLEYLSKKKFANEPENSPKTIFKDMLGIREQNKLLNSYLESLPLQVNSVSGRIHTNYNQARVVTGRLSSSEPNLQQVPKKYGPIVRQAFHPKEGHLFVQCDFSQIELRILAALANDFEMIQAFKDGKDLHSRVAKTVFNLTCTEEEVASLYPRQRDIAKTIGFGIVYGITEVGLSNRTELSRSAARQTIETYLNSFPTIEIYMEDRKKECRLNKYVKTYCGRRRRLIDKFGGRNFGWERAAGNFPIQGSASDLVKIAMIAVCLGLPQFNAKLLLQIHDEVIIECPIKHAKACKIFVKEAMETSFAKAGYKLDVPLIAEPTLQRSWGDKLTKEEEEALE